MYSYMERQVVYAFEKANWQIKRADELFKVMKENNFGHAGAYQVFSSRTRTKVADLVSNNEYEYFIIPLDTSDEPIEAKNERERFKTLLDKF